MREGIPRPQVCKFRDRVANKKNYLELLRNGDSGQGACGRFRAIVERTQADSWSENLRSPCLSISAEPPEPFRWAKRDTESEQ